MFLHGTIDYGTLYQGRPWPDRMLDCRFVDVYWARDLDHNISTSGYLFNLFRGASSSMSKRWDIVSMSTTEVEYMVGTHASKEKVWLQILCSGVRSIQ